MTAEEITIPCSKYDWLWAQHDYDSKDPASTTLVIMIHGFPGDSRSYGDVFGALSDTFVKSGLHTLRYDMRGCGQSDKGASFFTLREASEDGVHVFRWAEKLGYKKFFVITEGLGATIGLMVLNDAIRQKVRGAVMLWPIFNPKDSWLGAAMGEEIGEKLRQEIQDYDFNPLMPRLSMPALILRGSLDTKAPASQIDALKSGVLGLGLETVTLDGGDYGLKTAPERQILLNQADAFFRKIA